VYSLYIINKSGGLIFQKDLVHGLARLDTNEALTQASIWLGCAAVPIRRLSESLHAGLTHRHYLHVLIRGRRAPPAVQALAPCHLRAALSGGGLHWHAGATHATHQPSTTQLRALTSLFPSRAFASGVRMLGFSAWQRAPIAEAGFHLQVAQAEPSCGYCRVYRHSLLQHRPQGPQSTSGGSDPTKRGWPAAERKLIAPR
jgi:hypothetical protein